MRRFVAAGLMVVLLAVAGCSSAPLGEGQAGMPASSDAFEGENYRDVVEALEDAGFTNVEARALGDLITGWLNHPDSVKEVTVGFSTSFRKGDVFDTDEKIIVRYHSFPEGQEEPEETSEPESGSPEATPGRTAPADAVRARFLEAFGVETEMDLLPIYLQDPVAPTYAIYEWENVGGDWVRVYIQENMTGAEAIGAGKQILGLTCADFPALAGIVVRGVDGIDINVPRSEMPLCQM